MLTIRELLAGLVGVGRLLRLRADAFDCFDASLTGFWRSMRLAVILAPASAILVLERMAEVNPADPLHFATMQAIGYAVGWLAYPLLMVRISVFLDRGPRYFTYMVAYNWFQTAVIAMMLGLTLLAHGGLPMGLLTLLQLLGQGLLLVYGWFIARRGLLVETATATALVVIDLLLGVLIDVLATG